MIYKIYYKLPFFFQNIVISLYGLYWKKRRFGGVFKKEVDLFRSRNSFSKKQWYEYQEKELRKLLVHSFTNVPFYKKKYTEAGFSLGDFQTFKLNDLNKLPFLEKEELRQFGKTELLSRTRIKGNFYSSSGSTGTPVNIYFSRNFHQKWSAAFEVRIREWAGVNRHNCRAMIGGRLVVPVSQKKPPYFRFNRFENQLYFSINHLSKLTAKSYIESMNKFGVECLTGYANSIWLLAKYGIDLNLDSLKLKSVITSSEKLTELMRKDISNFFKCKVYDSYSGIECCGLISEYENGMLHWSPDVSVMESITKDTIEGDLRELVCTGLLNFDQPLIRYRIGDLISLSLDKIYESKIEMPVIKEIVGRTDDIVTLKDGRQLGSFNRFFADIIGLNKVQVIQYTHLHFHLNVVKSDDFDESTIKQIRSVFQNRIGEVKLTFDFIKEIPTSKNGKFKAVISKI
jgi:phenylacetate-CoA ligase